MTFLELSWSVNHFVGKDSYGVANTLNLYSFIVSRKIRCMCSLWAHPSSRERLCASFPPEGSRHLVRRASQAISLLWDVLYILLLHNLTRIALPDEMNVLGPREDNDSALTLPRISSIQPTANIEECDDSEK